MVLSRELTLRVPLEESPDLLKQGVCGDDPSVAAWPLGVSGAIVPSSDRSPPEDLDRTGRRVLVTSAFDVIASHDPKPITVEGTAGDNLVHLFAQWGLEQLLLGSGDSISRTNSPLSTEPSPDHRRIRVPSRGAGSPPRAHAGCEAPNRCETAS